MEEFQLVKDSDHLFVTLAGERWLVDTGSPVSFGNIDHVTILGDDFRIARDYMGMKIEMITDLVRVPCAGLIGVDILNRYDVIFDLPGSRLVFSSQELKLAGETLLLEKFMGVPVINVNISGTSWRMAFDTGAQVSYYEDEKIRTFPPAGQFVDFFPGIGNFTVDAYQVRVQIGSKEYQLRCGSLPKMLGSMLNLMNVDGVLGNEICASAKIGYFPNRERFVIE